MPPPDWLATPRAHASLRRMTLSDGPEAGLDCLALSTGGGLDAWLLAGRSLDIGPLWWRGRQLSWTSPAGLAHAALHRPDSEGGRGFERMFGGFLVTCGLTHVRQSESAEPLHGRLPFTPARVLLARERFSGAEPLLEAEAEIVQARLGHEALLLRRRIEAPVGGAVLRIRDEVENIGPGPAPHAVLYHVNLGWPLLAAGTRVLLDGADITGPLAPGDPAAQPAVICHPSRGEVRVVSSEGMTLTLRSDAAMLPFAQVWHDLRPRVAVLSVEPCSTARGDPAPPLAPGERRAYALDFAFKDAP